MALSKIKATGITDASITAAHIAADTIAAADIAANAVGASELADNAVDTAAIAADAVDGTKLADNAVNSEHYTDGSIDNVHVATGLDAVKLADGSVTNAELQYINSLSSNAQTQITSTTTVASAALPKAGGTMSGETIFADQLATRAKLKDYSESYNASSGTGSTTLDLTTGNVFQHTASGGNVTFVFSNPPASGAGGSFTLKWIQDSSDRTATWPASVDWAGGTAPTLTSGSAKIDMFTFVTFDAGTTWYGFVAGQDLR
jgi:hypothetical protein